MYDTIYTTADDDDILYAMLWRTEPIGCACRNDVVVVWERGDQFRGPRGPPVYEHVDSLYL